MSEEDLGRSALKRRAILDAARTVFLRNGYLGTSMDQIAALAAVSKQTVYKNFADKERLFAEIITSSIAEAEQQSTAILDALPDTEDLEHDLRDVARSMVTVVMSPHIVALRRIIIGEADRFPDLARSWYESGPGRGSATMAERFSALARRGLVHIDDPLLAAQHFNWLVLSIPMNKAMFYGAGEQFTTAELEHFADEGVRVFLAAYGARPS